MRPKTYLLAKSIHQRKDILFGNGDGKCQHSVKEKEDAWEAVRVDMIQNGFSNFEKKTWREVRNYDWQYLRRSAVAKFEQNQKSIDGTIRYTAVDKLVFDIMGSESVGDGTMSASEENHSPKFFSTKIDNFDNDCNSISAISTNEFVNNNNNDGEMAKSVVWNCSAPSTSAGSGDGGCGAFNGSLNALFGAKFNNISTSSTTLDNDQQQLLLAMMANNLSVVLANPVSSTIGSDASAENFVSSLTDSFLTTLKVASSRKRNSDILAYDYNNVNVFNIDRDKYISGSISANNNHSSTKRCRKQASHLNLYDDESKTSLAGTSNLSAISPAAEHRWRNDVMEIQKTILDNQRRILAIIERQTALQQEERELRARSLSASQSPPSPPLNARQHAVGVGRSDSAQPDDVSGATLLATLCKKLDVLANTLASIDSTFKSHFAATDKSNSEIHQRSVVSVQTFSASH